jgi:hypothetical protein
MPGHQFEYGPVLKGTFLGISSIAVVVGLYFPDLFYYYILVLLFLGLGLRPLLEKTGLYENYCGMLFMLQEKLDKKWVAKRRAELDRKARDERLRHSRVKDPRLPRNW